MSTADAVMQELEITRFKRTDTGNAKLIAHLYGDKIRFDYKRNRWLIWNGHIWKPDINGEIQRLAKQAAEERLKSVFNINDSKEKGDTAKWAIRSEDNQKINAAISLLKSEHPVADSGENWDKNPMLLGCENGVLDLAIGELRNGKPEDRITMVCGATFNPTATCPRWQQFLQEVFEGDAELIHYIHKALGYSLTGDMNEQVAFFCHGSGSNGKSVMFQSVREVLGEYGHDAPSSLLEKNQNSSASNDERETEGKRFIVYSETLTTSRLNEQRLKKMTGGDAITARQLYERNVTFKPTAKIWMFLNHKPSVSDDSYAFWRRVRLIPFNRTFKPTEQEKGLDKKILAEKEGILAWLVRGCLLWQQERLMPVPETVQEGTMVYRQENDVLVEFLAEYVANNGDGEVKALDLFKSYKTWAEEAKLAPKEILSLNAFGKRMSDKFEKKRLKAGIHYLVQAEAIYLIPGEGGEPSFTHFKATVKDKGSFPITSSNERNIEKVIETGGLSYTQPGNPNPILHQQEENTPDEFMEEVKEALL